MGPPNPPDQKKKVGYSQSGTVTILIGTDHVLLLMNQGRGGGALNVFTSKNLEQ